MEKKNNSVGKTMLIVLLLIVTIVSLILATYAWAKYTTTVTGSSTAQVAKWDVKFTPASTVFTKNFTHVVNERLAPGTSGKIAMTVVSTDTEVDYHYTLNMSKITNKPTNLHFYTDEACTAANEIAVTGTTATAYNDVPVTLSGNKAATNKEINIYWKWEYETTKIPTSVPTAAEAKVVADLETLATRNNVTLPTYAEGATNSAKITALKSALKTASIADTEVGKTINDAIDTVEGEAAAQMSFDVNFTATQDEPTV